MLYRPQVANIDQVMIFVSIVKPNISLNLLDKYLVMSEKFNVKPIIIINKTDLVDKETLDYYIDLYTSVGYEVIENSNLDTPNEKIKSLLKDKITSVVGPSGVGKSTTLNNISPNLNLETGEISSKTKRGKHTTRHIEIKEIFKNSYVFDTPGFSSLEIDFIKDREDIKDYFIEFREYSKNCKFHNCMHIKEPGCGVKDAVEKGYIKETRYKNYLNFIEEFDKIRRY